MFKLYKIFLYTLTLTRFWEDLGWTLKNVGLLLPNSQENSRVGRLGKKVFLPGCPIYFALNVKFSIIIKNYLPTRSIKISMY